MNETYIENELINIKLDDFLLETYDNKNFSHVVFKEKLINSNDSKLISNDIDNYIIKTKKSGKIDKISNVYVVKYRNDLIGMVFVNYHPEEEKEDVLLKEEIEIGLGLLDEYKGMHLGSLIEKELSTKLLNIYPQFNEIVVRINEDNIESIKSAKNAGFIQIGNDEYHFKR